MPIKTKPHVRVLVVIPTLGERLDLLDETLSSIISQSELVDIVLVAPAKPGITRLAKKYKALLADDPGGLSAALNAGFEQAKPHHEFGAWMGDDDLLRPGAIEATIKVLDINPDAVLAYGYCDYIDTSGEVIFTSRAGSLAPFIMQWGPNLLPLPGLLYRLKAANEVGGYDSSLKYAMDLDMWLRLRKKGRFINTQKILGAFRWHPTSTTVANRRASLNEAAMVKRRYLTRIPRALTALWEPPVKFATHVAAKRLNKKVAR